MLRNFLILPTCVKDIYSNNQAKNILTFGWIIGVKQIEYIIIIYVFMYVFVCAFDQYTRTKRRLKQSVWEWGYNEQYQ